MSIDTDSDPLDNDAASELDQQIQDAAEQAGDHLDTLFDLLKEAETGQVHLALGFESWTAYLADRFKPITKKLDADDRRALIAELHEHGMSVRAIAEAVGTSKSTVAREVSQSGTGEDKTLGVDGNTYPRRRNGGGGYRGELKPHMRLNRAVKAIEGINVAAAKDQAKLRQQLQDTREQVCKLIDELLANIQPALATDRD